MTQGLQTFLTTLVVTLGTITTAYFTVLPQVLEYQVEDASDSVAKQMAIENRKLMEDWRAQARNTQDSLWRVGVEFMNNVQENSSKPPAIVIRVLPDGSFQYNASYNKLQPAWWITEYKWWMYTDLRDGEMHPIIFEDKISLEQMKYRAMIMYDEKFLDKKIDNRIKLNNHE